MDKFKSKLNAANEKLTDAVGGSGGSGKHLTVHSAFSPQLHDAINSHNKELDEVKALHKELDNSTKRVKELAVSMSKLAGVVPMSQTGLKDGALELTKLNKIGDKWAVLSNDLDHLLKGDFNDCGKKNHNCVKLAKHVESLMKKNDADALTQQNHLKAEMEALETNIASASVRYRALLERVSSEWLAVVMSQFRESSHVFESMGTVEVKAPPAIHRN